MSFKINQVNLDLHPECPFASDRLRLLDVEHFNFNGDLLDGKLVVLDRVAVKVISIFKELKTVRFPIHQVKLIDHYHYNDDESMAANNSSAFNFRNIANSDRLSMHSYGLAIDINPVQNPYLTIEENGIVKVHPSAGVDFLNRSNIRPGMLETVVHIFEKYGFTVWGGKWNNPIDYHHFEVPRSQVVNLV
ncbi:MAG: M15 family metallopeptidase [Rickettsiales bacterium]|nr:M15 family metallopeptidase [Rickettsiales bacterium]